MRVTVRVRVIVRVRVGGVPRLGVSLGEGVRVIVAEGWSVAVYVALGGRGVRVGETGGGGVLLGKRPAAANVSEASAVAAAPVGLAAARKATWMRLLQAVSANSPHKAASKKANIFLRVSLGMNNTLSSPVNALPGNH